MLKESSGGTPPAHALLETLTRYTNVEDKCDTGEVHKCDTGEVHKCDTGEVHKKTVPHNHMNTSI